MNLRQKSASSGSTLMMKKMRPKFASLSRPDSVMSQKADSTVSPDRVLLEISG